MGYTHLLDFLNFVKLCYCLLAGSIEIEEYSYGTFGKYSVLKHINICSLFAFCFLTLQATSIFNE